MSTTTTNTQTQTSMLAVARASTSQSHIDNLTNILQHGPGAHGNPGGGGGQPQGPPSGGQGPPGGGGSLAAQLAAQPAAPANPDVKPMGNLPPTFNSNRKEAEDFIKSVKQYIHLNANVTGFNSYIK
jgi:hypothetical protein